MSEEEINKAFDEEYIKYRDAFPKDYDLPTYFTSKHAISMTLRDYLAMNATNADIEPHLYDCSEMIDGVYYSPTKGDFVPTKYPKKRSREEAKYLYADAMMKAREA